jgi:hypothetical protein
MDPALLTLMRLQWGAFVRRTVRGARSPRGLMYFLVGLSVVALWLGPQVFRGMHRPMTDPDRVRALFPLGLLGVCVMTLLTNGGGRAFYFTPAEVDFLFPGPFTRRQVLLYKIAKSATATLIGSLFFSCFMLSRVYHWLAGYIAIVLAMMFLQLFSMTLVLLGQSLGERFFARGRTLALALIACVVVAILWALNQSQTPITLDSFLALTRASAIARTLLFPFAVFGNLATSRSLIRELPLWTAAALLIDATLVLLVLWLDADYLENSAIASEKLYARRMRARHGQGMTSAKLATGLHLPMPPRLAGAGPLAWRQLTSAARSARTTLLVLGGAMLAAAPFIRRYMHTDPLPPVLAIGGWLTMFTTNLLRFDFRGDLEQMDALKALPLASAAVVAGEVAAPVTILSLLHLLLLTGLWIVQPRLTAIIVSLALIVMPLNLLFSLIENLIFLVFPVRELQLSPGDLQGTGRRMIVLVLKLLGVIVVGTFATIAAMLVYAFDGNALPPACAAAAVVLLGADVALFPVLGLAFRRFDPSVHTPA